MKSFKVVSVLVAVALVCGYFVNAEEKKCPQKRKEAEDLLKRQGSASALAIVVPKCNPDNTYAQLQCFQNSEFCLCWDKEGNPVTQPKNKLRECSCMIKRSEELNKTPPSRQGEVQLTECEQSGLYKPRQCKNNVCHCVNPKTGAKTGTEGSPATLKC